MNTIIRLVIHYLVRAMLSLLLRALSRYLS